MRLSATLLILSVAGAACGDDPLSVAPDSGTDTEIDGSIQKPEEDAGDIDPPLPGADAGPGVPDSGPRCEASEVETSGLSFDGVDDHVTMGAAPALGLQTFTVEGWVRRDGPGRTMGTGVGGLTMVPIAGKGHGESDGTNVDCNYAFGFFGDVLGADFEDYASGANHPIIGKTAVPLGEWHHLAVTYDGSLWHLLIDGRIDAEVDTNGATPRYDSIQHFGIGTAFNSTGVPAGRLHGAVDEVRVWDHARTEEEIARSMFETLETGDGLLGRWALDVADGETALDSTGTNNGTIVGATYLMPGTVLDKGQPSLVLPLLPAAEDTVTATNAELQVGISDVDSDAFQVEFFARPITDADDFTIVVLPDTQYYTVNGNGFEHFFYDQTQWIVDNAAAYNIVAVIHNGDIVDRANQNYQWTVADRALSTLEEPFENFPDGMPWGPTVGNHDETPNSSPTGTTEFNRWFGIARFEGRSYYGGHYGSTNDENWFTFNAGGLDFVVVNMKFNANPDAAVFAWGRQVFAAHPDSFGILNSHYILTGGGNFGPQGQRIYDALRDVQNLQLMTCGHVSNESRRTDTYQGHPIHSMLADYQGRANGGGGTMRIWEFSPANDELTVRSYSPTADVWETDANSEFTLPVDLSGAAGEAFAHVGTVEIREGTQTATVSLPVRGLRSGVLYEWYATVNDCDHNSQSAVQRFRTLP